MTLDIFVEGLLPELIDWLDRPSAFFGHCLGGLTMFATLCALPEECARFVKHAFPCGVRPPHLLKRRGAFEDNVVYSMMLHREFDVRVPFYAQADEIVADIIRQFDTQAANKMLEIPKLRHVLLPTIRAEFGMAFKYEYQPTELFSFPISSFVGDLDPWVSETRLRRLERADPRPVHQSCAQGFTFFDGGRRASTLWRQSIRSS